MEKEKINKQHCQITQDITQAHVRDSNQSGNRSSNQNGNQTQNIRSETSGPESIGSEVEVISFRPHHFMCTTSFRGKGYSLGFIKNYKKIVAKLKENEDIIIEVATYMDDICSPCPNKLDDIVCKEQEKILQLDKRHLKVLGLKAGDRLSWREAKEIIAERMSLDDFHYACEGCMWKPYGMCEESLLDLKKQSDKGLHII